MQNYLLLMRDILQNGHTHEDRTGVGRRSVFGRELRFDLTTGGFPLVTTRQVFVKGMIHETLMMLQGRIDAVTALEAHGVNIWKAWTPTAEDAHAFVKKLTTGPDFMEKVPLDVQNEFVRLYLEMPLVNGEEPNVAQCLEAFFASKIGTIGPMYGFLWRGNYSTGNDQKGPDQLSELVKNLRTNPFGSRHTVTAQIPALLPFPQYSPQENVLLGRGALAPCHCYFQCFVTPALPKSDQLRLSLKIEIRSSDVPVGLPYNISQYALILMLLAQCTNMMPHELIVSIGDAHIYKDQIDLVSGQIGRVPYPPPTMKINPDKTDLFSFTPEDFTLENYQFHPAINYPVAT
jgi:thymidylate synthase